MTEFRLERDNDVPLVFNGTILARSSSGQLGRERWTELTLYRTESDKYVVSIVGRSIHEDEFDRYTVRVVKTPQEVRKALHRKGDHGKYLTYVALDLLDMAARHDPSFGELEERI